MCGIAGFCLNPKHNQNQTELAAQMLMDIEHRGFHATGAAWINPKSGHRVITKAPVAASQFIKTDAGKRLKQLKVKRHGQVDSEAVAALIAFTAAPITEVLSQVQGTAALAWIEQGKGNTLHLARVNSSPLWIGQTATGSLVYGSTEETIENASIMLDSDLDWSYSANEGEYFKVKNGKIVEHQNFEPFKKVYTNNWRGFGKLRDEELDKLWADYDELAF